MLQTSPVVKHYYRCLEAGSPYKDGEWERMQAACSSQGPGGPPGRGRGRAAGSPAAQAGAVVPRRAAAPSRAAAGAAASSEPRAH